MTWASIVKEACQNLSIDETVVDYIASILEDDPSQILDESATLTETLSAFIEDPSDCACVANKLVAAAAAAAEVAAKETPGLRPQLSDKTQQLLQTKLAAGEVQRPANPPAPLAPSDENTTNQAEKRRLRKERQAQARARSKKRGGSAEQNKEKLKPVEVETSTSPRVAEPEFTVNKKGTGSLSDSSWMEKSSMHTTAKVGSFNQYQKDGGLVDTTSVEGLSNREKREQKRNAKKQSDKTDDEPAAETDVQLVLDNLHRQQTEELAYNASNSGEREATTFDDNAELVVCKNLTIAYDAAELLHSTKLVIRHGNKGHRYGIVGDNGVGKTTLLAKIAMGSHPTGLPGWPVHVRTLMVQQEVLGSDTVTVLQSLLDAKSDWAGGKQLEQEKEELEAIMDEEGKSGNVSADMAVAAERLGQVYGELETLNSSETKDKARAILRGLGFKGKDALQSKTATLSGGWRTRLALAQALFIAPAILLLDEPTNHLDVKAVQWLIKFLVGNVPTCLVVSHEQHFLEAVCTCVIKFEDRKLRYFVGSYERYCERMAAEGQSETRKEKDAQKGAARAREQQLRVGGKKNAKHLQQITQERQELQRRNKSKQGKALRFRFPNAGAAQLRKATPLVTLERAHFGYLPDKVVLSGMTLGVAAGSKIAVIGGNGAGKTTLIRLIIGELAVTSSRSEEMLQRRQNLRIAYVGQHHVEQLAQHLLETPTQYLSARAFGGREAFAGGDQEQLLRNFGLEDTAELPIGSLSGGQKARLAMAVAVSKSPHLIVLDEPTNHLDRDSIDALLVAVREFKGAILMVSHNETFLGQCCNEMWIVQGGKVRVEHVDETGGSYGTSFEDIYAALDIRGEQ